MQPIRPLFLALVRTEATASADRTLGVLLANGEHFCHVLEDTLRAPGVKIPGVTAIPAGLYRVTLDKSPKFGRVTPHILNVPNFDGIRMHGGNKPEDSEGCPLVAFNRSGIVIQGTAEAKLLERIQEAGGSCLIAIIDYLKALP